MSPKPALNESPVLRFGLDSSARIQGLGPRAGALRALVDRAFARRAGRGREVFLGGQGFPLHFADFSNDPVARAYEVVQMHLTGVMSKLRKANETIAILSYQDYLKVRH